MSSFSSLRGRADQIERQLRKNARFKEEEPTPDFSQWSTKQLRAYVHWTPGVPYSGDIQELLRGMGIDELIKESIKRGGVIDESAKYR